MIDMSFMAESFNAVLFVKKAFDFKYIHSKK